MNLDFTDEQIMLKNLARNFLQKECPKDLVRKMEESEEGYSQEIWVKMAELGWLGFIIPEKYGGTGLKFLDLTILLEEMGYNLLPGPFFSTIISAIPIIEVGTEEQKNKYLPKIANGRLKLTLAINEPSATYDPSGIKVKAVSAGNAYLINGIKLFVENAHIADYLICLARTDHKQIEDGITIFLIDAKNDNITKVPMPTIGMDKQYEVHFRNVNVEQENILGNLNRGWKIIKSVLEKAAIAKCAEMVGGMQASLEMTNAYAKERIAYGRTISSFQVIQHYLADAWVKVETSRNITYEAAWMATQDLPISLKAAVAKAWVGEAFSYVTERCVHIHGAIGMTREHTIGLYYRRAKAWNLAFGDRIYQYNKIAQELSL